MTTNNKALTAKLRLARNIHEGMEVRPAGSDEWLLVTRVLHITAPLQVSSFVLSDGTDEPIEASCHPRDRVMCRHIGAHEERSTR